MTGPAILAAFDLPWTPIYILLAMFIHPLIGLVGWVLRFLSPRARFR